MTKKYRLIIYAASAVIHFYNKDVNITDGMTVSEFKEHHKNLIDRVFEEIKGTFDYEMSGEQMNRAVYAYMCGATYPMSTENTKPYNHANT